MVYSMDPALQDYRTFPAINWSHRKDGGAVRVCGDGGDWHKWMRSRTNRPYTARC